MSEKEKTKNPLEEGETITTEAGYCPNCGSGSLDYKKPYLSMDGNSEIYEITCVDCGFEGKEWYILEFNTITDMDDNDMNGKKRTVKTVSPSSSFSKQEPIGSVLCCFVMPSNVLSPLCSQVVDENQEDVAKMLIPVNLVAEMQGLRGSATLFCRELQNSIHGLHLAADPNISCNNEGITYRRRYMK